MAAPPALSALSGIVLDEKNQPVEGAVVVLAPSSFREEPTTDTSDAMECFVIPLSGMVTVAVSENATAQVRVTVAQAASSLSKK